MSKLKPYIELLRPHQWLKNLMLFFPPFLGGTILLPGMALRGVLPFLLFCIVSSASYIFNDILDKTNDLHHPDKRTRPLPAGRVTVESATLLAAVLVISSLSLAWLTMPPGFVTYLSLYLIITLAYTFCLKKYALVDIFCISAGFLLRLEAGGSVFNIVISDWLFLSVFLLALFLSTGKRLSEKKHLGISAVHHRKALNAYPDGFLEGAMYMTGAVVLVTYTMYVISRHSGILIYTVPLCSFGLLRYIQRIQCGKGGDPTESLLKDVPLFIVGVVWMFMVGWGVYGR